MNKQHTKVLIIDDNKIWVDILVENVIKAGFVPMSVDNLDSARELLKNEEVKIVITDVFLREPVNESSPPEGLWFLNDIREFHQKMGRGPYVIVVSGSDQLRGKEAQKLFDYRDIVVDFIYKQGFSVPRFLEDLRKAEEVADELVPQKRNSQPPELDDLSYTIENQPWYAPGFPATLEVDFNQIETLRDEIDVVLITATDEEIKAVMRLLEPYPRRKGILKTFVGPETYYLGKFGEYRVVVTKCRMGAIGEGSVILATEQAQRIWQPRAVIMIGIAFGKDPLNQVIADVMVASQIISYEQQRVGDKIIYHGPITPSNPTLLNRFTNVSNWWFTRPDGKVCKILTGSILSGEKLVDNPEFKAELFDQYPQAIGGEMEGAGLCAASGRLGVAWILVKAISDWGDGKKHNKHQPLATAAATSLVHHVLSQKTALNSINKHTS